MAHKHNSSDLEGESMNPENYNTSMIFANQSLAQDFIDEHGITDYWIPFPLRD